MRYLAHAVPAVARHHRIAAALLVLAAAIAAAPADALQYGTAQGGLTVGGTRIELTHAYLLPENWIFESRKSEAPASTVVVLADRAIDAAMLADARALSTAGRESSLRAVQVRIQNDTGEVLNQRLYGPADASTEEIAGTEGSLWLRGEFSDRVMWGALGSDGELPLAEGTWRYEAFFAASFPEPPAAKLGENGALGVLKLDNKATKLAHARAYLEDRTPEGGDPDTYTVVVLTSAAIDNATARDGAALLKFVKKAKSTALKIWVHDQSGNVTRQEWTTAKGARSVDNPEKVRWAAWEFTPDLITGFFTTDGTRRTDKTTWEYEAHVHATIDRGEAAAQE